MDIKLEELIVNKLSEEDVKNLTSEEAMDDMFDKLFVEENKYVDTQANHNLDIGRVNGFMTELFKMVSTNLMREERIKDKLDGYNVNTFYDFIADNTLNIAERIIMDDKFSFESALEMFANMYTLYVSVVRMEDDFISRFISGLEEVSEDMSISTAMAMHEVDTDDKFETIITKEFIDQYVNDHSKKYVEVLNDTLFMADVEEN